jgi:hypothetical protein
MQPLSQLVDSTKSTVYSAEHGQVWEKRQQPFTKRNIVLYCKMNVGYMRALEFCNSWLPHQEMYYMNVSYVVCHERAGSLLYPSNLPILWVLLIFSFVDMRIVLYV